MCAHIVLISGFKSEHFFLYFVDNLSDLADLVTDWSVYGKSHEKGRDHGRRIPDD